MIIQRYDIKRMCSCSNTDYTAMLRCVFFFCFFVFSMSVLFLLVGHLFPEELSFEISSYTDPAADFLETNI